MRQTAEAMWSLALAQPWPDLDWPELIEALISLGRTDIPLSRLVEGHIDALRILKEADHPAVPDSLYAVWASRSHATGISARPTEAGWRLSGILRFASGVGVVDRALVPVWLDADTHLLLDLDVGCWPADESAWQTSAMAVSRSHTVTLDDLPAPGSSRIGDSGFYLNRPGFFVGGIGVAAVWAGGAARLADLLEDVTDGAPPAASRSVRLGQVRTELSTAHAVLSRAASVLIGQSGSRLDADGLRTLATETRAAVAAAVHRVLELARTVAGPAGLAYAAELTHAVDDLNLYVRQQNADADFTYLGDAP
ncbi:MAG: hypothetical protein ABIZ07_05160 [Dermatophilaceae bacterium]